MADGGATVDAITFGLQVPDFSIGRDVHGVWTLNKPTFGTANVVQQTGDPRRLGQEHGDGRQAGRGQAEAAHGGVAPEPYAAR